MKENLLYPDNHKLQNHNKKSAFKNIPHYDFQLLFYRSQFKICLFQIRRRVTPDVYLPFTIFYASAFSSTWTTGTYLSQLCSCLNPDSLLVSYPLPLTCNSHYSHQAASTRTGSSECASALVATPPPHGLRWPVSSRRPPARRPAMTLRKSAVMMIGRPLS